MKAYIIFFFLGVTFRLTAQPNTYLSDDVFVPIGKETPSYKLYWYPTSKVIIKNYNRRKILLRSVVIKNGLEQTTKEYSDGAITRIIQYFYRDTFRVRAVIQFPQQGLMVKCTYGYDPVSHLLVSEKWTSNGKVVYHWQRQQVHDTTRFIIFHDWEALQFRTREDRFTSPDGLTQTNILYMDSPSGPQYTIQLFDKTHRLIKETDSSSDNLTNKRYDYDHSGRLIKEVWTAHGYNLISEYIYKAKETYCSTFSLYENHVKQLSGELLLRYDAMNRVCFEEETKYEKAESGGPSPGMVIRKQYRNNRLMKVQKFSNKDLLHTFVIQYFPEKKTR